MFRLDTLRLIKKTVKRFLTIFLMVFIGVSFMVGLLSTAPIMYKSVDDYYDEYNFMDVQLYSSYGFDDKDVQAIKDTDEIDKIFASKFVDVFASYKDLTFVTRVQELESDVNQFELLSGRLPKEANEALIIGDEDFNTLIPEGETLTLFLEDGELDESLKLSKYKVVGTARSGQYMANQLETSNLNNLDIQNVIYIPNENFVADYYTSVYVTFKDSKSYTSFTKKYKDFIKENIKELEDTAELQQDHRKNEIIKEIEDEIKKGEAELNKETSSAQQQIDDGRKKLEDAYIQLLVGEATFATNEKQIEAGYKEIEKNTVLLNNAKKQVDDGVKQVESETGKPFDEAYQSIEMLHSLYTVIESIANDENSTLTIKERIDANKKEISSLEAQNAKYELEKIRIQMSGGNQSQLDELDKKIEDNNTKIDDLNEENAVLNIVLTMFNNTTLSSVLTMLDDLAGGNVKDSYKSLKELYDAKKQVEDGLAQIESAKAELDAGKKQLDEGKKELEKGRKDYESGLLELNKAQLKLDTEVEKARIEIEKGKQQLAELPDAGWIILDRESHYSSLLYDNNATQMNKIGTIFPLLFFAVAALVCMTTMKRLVDEQRSQIGIFSALGFTKNQVIGKYVMYSFMSSLPASILGMFFGIPTFPVVIYVCWRLMYNLPAMKLYLPVHAGVIGVASFTLLMMIVTYFVAKESLGEMPSQLMRPKAPKKAKKVFLEYIPFIWNKLSFTSKVTARNLIRYKSRFFMTVLGVVGCTSLLVLGFGIKDSISQIIDIQFRDIFQYEYSITLNDYLDFEEMYELIDDDKNIDEAIPHISYASKVYLEDEKTTTVYVVDEDDYEDFVNLRTRVKKEKIELDDGVVISEKFAKTNNLKVGDSITIESSHGIKKEVEIAGICEMYFQHYLFMTTQEYEKTFNETVRYDLIAINAEDGEEFIEDYENCELVKSITDFETMKNRFQSMIEALDIIVVVILLASGSLAFVVLVNLTEVNISERIREIATLKVLGFFDGEVNSYIFKEILLLALIGAVAGLPVGKGMLGLVMNIIDMEMLMFGNDIKLMSYVYGFVITMGFAIIVLLSMKGSLKKVEMVESLKSVE